MMKSRNKLSFIVIVIFIFLIYPFFQGFGSVCAMELREALPEMNAIEQEDTYAKSMAVIERDSGRLLYQKNSDQKMAMASTTKIMTALVVIKNCTDLDEVFQIDSRAVGVEGTSLYLRKNENKSVRELLYGLMLPSGNDAAVALACRIAGGNDEFCVLMNEEAERIGAINTSFVNPHGLDEKNHYTTAYDLALITAEAMRNDIFKEIVATKNTRVSGNKEVSAKLLNNKNKLLSTVEGCNGVKTGFTDNAGRCFVGSVERDGMNLIGVVLNCGPMFEEIERLLEKGFKEYKVYELLASYSPGPKIKVNKGVDVFVETLSRKKFLYPLREDEYMKVKYEVDVPDFIEAPVEKEKVVGEMRIKIDNCLLFKEKIYTMNYVESTKFFDKLEKVIDYWNI